MKTFLILFVVFLLVGCSEASEEVRILNVEPEVEAEMIELNDDFTVTFTREDFGIVEIMRVSPEQLKSMSENELVNFGVLGSLYRSLSYTIDEDVGRYLCEKLLPRFCIEKEK